MAVETNILGMMGVDHPALAADDVELLTTWYCEVLGYQPWFEYRTTEPPKLVWMLKAPDGTLLEIMPKDDTSRQKRTTWTPGWSHLALRVKDIEQAICYLDQHNITWAGELSNAIGGGRVRNFLDIEGNLLQILERTSPL
ncbi:MULTISPECIES: VOC family protein [unclassified Arcicella]|uniref:VOC family protein n=1 Tax=unclassified Arcicella TaxID=2644986 RepID=UPI0028542205|nr:MULTISPECIES: VOC family protein [unclassified Arcicella]MDR6562275.1 catechol 2,3-dioxygenase-like lactoylglutathione lyase family enzyme [Arcicella sp. BE51]MDR6812031.1 catechol 2,3-dioxygenase-like lactoylglutathione lyase family enzyme [Arcicella sp. BE140]MDR6823342.1 catechol 2,3-dioxygenase-like lactoylglutathione lyase family enzyme [Arcicella sp. BE139]